MIMSRYNAQRYAAQHGSSNAIWSADFLVGWLVENADEDVGAPIPAYITFTGIPAIRFLHSAGPISCTERPCASTATVTGMSSTSNS